jgi:6-phosphogluconolactonase
MPKLLIFNTGDELSAAAAKQFGEVVTAAVAARGAACVALSGGGTPLAMYRLLARQPYRDSLPWGRIHFFWGDERCVPPGDPESNFGQAMQAMLEPVSAPPENIHRVKGELPPEMAASDYAGRMARFAADLDRLIQALAGAPVSSTPERGPAWPRFDLVLLGLGADGHTASLFPGQVHPQEALATVIAVTADYQGRPANRVTFTPLVFNTARNVIFLATGENKASALAAVLQGPPDPLKFPAQRIQPAEGTVTWMVDRAAAGKLIE